MILWRRRRAWIKNESGQTATEYILLVSVVVLGILAAASLLIPNLTDGVNDLNESLKKRFENNPLTECGPGVTCGGE